ncbi:MAG TPA: glutamate 5-kinase [Elusimicrobiota bacterium]|nr:glutamate 5-kinase [Elusimicrobiota bacterium]
MSRKARLLKIQRLVVKVGTSLLTRQEGRLDQERMARFARELSDIRKCGVQVVLVSSGAIAAGMGELAWKKRPTDLAKKQAAAAVGQPRLMDDYRYFFRQEKQLIAQILLTKEDFDNRDRLRNIQATFETLLESNVIPVVNENDSVAVDEIRVGDNDSLAALVAAHIQADLLVLLTDVDGLMTRPPRQGEGELIHRVTDVTPAIEALAHSAPGSDGGTGGMLTKIRAAKYASRHNVAMVIASGQKPGVLPALVKGQTVGTLFLRAR